MGVNNGSKMRLQEVAARVKTGKLEDSDKEVIRDIVIDAENALRALRTVIGL